MGRRQRLHLCQVEVEGTGDGLDAERRDGRGSGTEQRGGEVDDQFVDQSGGEEGGEQGGPALEQHVASPSREQLGQRVLRIAGDRKSTRLNSSHVATSYAVFCLKKKTRRSETMTAGSTASPAARAATVRDSTT